MSPAAISPVRLHSAVNRARACEEILRLQAAGWSLTGAAWAIGRSPSSFCGQSSLLRRYIQGGIAGLERQSRGGAAACALSQQIESLKWFIPAGNWFYWSFRGRRGALRKAIGRVLALPLVPSGWRSETRKRFLGHLGLLETPACPDDLKLQIQRREREKKPLVPPRICRQIRRSPSTLRLYSLEMPVDDLVKLSLGALLKRLGKPQAGAVCKLTLELL